MNGVGPAKCATRDDQGENRGKEQAHGKASLRYRTPPKTSGISDYPIRLGTNGTGPAGLLLRVCDPTLATSKSDAVDSGQFWPFEADEV
jgi:hypothetical protein